MLDLRMPSQALSLHRTHLIPQAVSGAEIVTSNVVSKGAPKIPYGFWCRRNTLRNSTKRSRSFASLTRLIRAAHNSAKKLAISYSG